MPRWAAVGRAGNVLTPPYAPDMASAPLHVLTGAPGAGKSTLLPELVRASDGVVIADIDELLEDGALLGVPIAHPDAAADWPAYNRMWWRILDLPRRVGHPVLFLSPLVPAEFPGATAWGLLDCVDDTRRRRLGRRGWDVEQVDEALADAARYRDLVAPVFRTDHDSPAVVAERVLAWVGAEVS